MKFCANCGARYEVPLGVCPCCYRDQELPEEIIDGRLQDYQHRPPSTGEPIFGYPGERSALYLSVAVCLAILAVLGTATVGLILLVLAANLLFLVFSHLSIKAQMLQVSETCFHNVHRVAKVAAYRLRLPLPPVYITEDPGYNAYTAGFFRYGFVVVPSALVRDFAPDELLFVIGHELCHMKRYHTTWLTLMHPAQGAGAKFILAPLVRVIFNVWSVKSEYTADQAGLIACRNPRAAIMTMLKLAGGSEVEKKLDFGTSERLAGQEPEPGAALLEYLGTHPFISNRIRQLSSFASSSKYELALKLK
ncbi:MAG: M48 family metallopeptidase [Kiritimatiellae bacterium]|nr:M48 family metallopeptidase [Kiritimatiellia bacterium]